MLTFYHDGLPLSLLPHPYRYVSSGFKISSGLGLGESFRQFFKKFGRFAAARKCRKFGRSGVCNDKSVLGHSALNTNDNLSSRGHTPRPRKGVTRQHWRQGCRGASLKMASPGFTAGPARPVWMPRVPLRRVERSESRRQEKTRIKTAKKWLIRIHALTQQHALDSSRRLPQPPNAARLGQRCRSNVRTSRHFLVILAVCRRACGFCGIVGTLRDARAPVGTVRGGWRARGSAEEPL